MIKIIIVLANVLLPITAVTFSIFLKEVPFRWVFAFAITAHVGVRMWETFYTSRERQPQKFEGDWTLAVGTFAYIGMLFVVMFEFYLHQRAVNFGWFIAGISMYGIATRLRWWGTATLGSQWAIHVIGKQKTNKARLLNIGPYAFIRHPIYLGILIEELAIPLIASAFYSLFCVALINIPLLLIRLSIEEKASIQKFDRFSYDDYKNQTGMLLPKSSRGQFVLKLLGLQRKSD